MKYLSIANFFNTYSSLYTFIIL